MAQDKEIVLITGANVGIGYEIAKQLLHEHSDRFYILLGCRSVEKGTAAMKELHRSGYTGCEVVNIENTDANLIQEAVKVVDQKFGRLDVLRVNVCKPLSPPQ
jgi:NAD(P)-dependent dehydrogenase (short-subunit alcohol dehydrogenase family)